MAYEDRDHGLHGAEVIDDTDAHAGNWHAIQVVGGSAVIAAITAANITNAAGYVGLTLAENTIIRGRVTSITLTSGVVTAYNASE